MKKQPSRPAATQSHTHNGKQKYLLADKQIGVGEKIPRGIVVSCVMTRDIAFCGAIKEQKHRRKSMTITIRVRQILRILIMMLPPSASSRSCDSDDR